RRDVDLGLAGAVDPVESAHPDDADHFIRLHQADCQLNLFRWLLLVESLDPALEGDRAARDSTRFEERLALFVISDGHGFGVTRLERPEIETGANHDRVTH